MHVIFGAIVSSPAHTHTHTLHADIIRFIMKALIVLLASILDNYDHKC